MTEFGCPEVTLCGWQDVKILLLTNLSTAAFAVSNIMFKTKYQELINPGQLQTGNKVGQPNECQEPVSQSGRYNTFHAVLSDGYKL